MTTKAKICNYTFQFNEEMDVDKLGSVMEFAFPQKFISITRAVELNVQTDPAAQETLIEDIVTEASEFAPVRETLDDFRRFLHERLGG